MEGPLELIGPLYGNPEWLDTGQKRSPLNREVSLLRLTHHQFTGDRSSH
jgi:hypothetical protein